MFKQEITNMEADAAKMLDALRLRAYDICKSVRLYEEAALIGRGISKNKETWAAISACVHCLLNGMQDTWKDKFDRVKTIKMTHGLTDENLQEVAIIVCAKFIVSGKPVADMGEIIKEYNLSTAQKHEAAIRACAEHLSGSDSASDSTSKKIKAIAEAWGLDAGEIQIAALKACTTQLMNGKQVKDLKEGYNLSDAQMQIAALPAYKFLVGANPAMAADIAKDYLGREMELEATLVAYNLEIEKKNYETARKIAEKHDDAEHSLGMLVRLTGQIAQLDKLVGMEKRIVSGSTSNVTALVRKYVEDGGAD